jgi:excisionase family DNA binding protein
MSNDLPTSAAARILAVHPDTLKRWATEGKVPHYKTPGKQYRFKLEDLETLRDTGIPEQVAS